MKNLSQNQTKIIESIISEFEKINQVENSSSKGLLFDANIIYDKIEKDKKLIAEVELNNRHMRALYNDKIQEDCERLNESLNVLGIQAMQQKYIIIICRIDGEKIPWPYNAQNFIQNMFNAPGGRSLFPFTPHLGYTFFGAGIGVVLHSIWINKSKWNIPLFLFLLGVVLAFFSTDILYFLHYKFMHFFGFGIMYLAKANWLFENLGWILMILGFLSAIEKIFTIKDNIFIRIGQNTLSIFIVHMMILYGAIINVGIATYINRTHNALNPYEAAIYAALFICIFVIMIYFIKPLSDFYNKSLDVLFPIRKKYRK